MPIASALVPLIRILSPPKLTPTPEIAPPEEAIHEARDDGVEDEVDPGRHHAQALREVEGGDGPERRAHVEATASAGSRR